MSDASKSLEENRHLMDLYSRQIGAFGMDAMVKLVSMKVLIVGCRGVGIETAKNVVLAGAHTVTLHDPLPTELRDLGSNFFLTEDDVGRPRDEACAPRLAELNPLVRVRALGEDLSEEVVSRYNAVVFTGPVSLPELIRWDEFCRSRTKTVVDARGFQKKVPAPIAFISCLTGGAAGSVFVDHGPEFTVRDFDGQQPIVKIIRDITPCFETVERNGKTVTEHYTLVRFITPVGQPPRSLSDGMVVEFSDIEGMFARNETTRQSLGYSLNESGRWRVWTVDGDPKDSIRIGDTRGFTGYLGGGVMTQVKEPQPLKFRSLAECIRQPSSTHSSVIAEASKEDGFVMVDTMSLFMPNGIEHQLHVAFHAVRLFQAKHGSLPEPNNRVHEDECVTHAHAFVDAMAAANAATPSTSSPAFTTEIDDKVIRRVARYIGAELQPMCTFFGGVVAQELVKLAGKFTPIRQFLNYHVFQALPSDDALPKDTRPVGGRYDDQIAVFGKAFVEKMQKLKVFMVGCGALGCEYIKNFALMGLCSGSGGQLHVTDNDRIEISNLSRQFLFREDNVGQPKSVAASARAKSMNPSININARQDLVAPDTEHIFDDAFWDGIDIVCNALDNMKARIYVDGKCVLHEKPLLESGTMGTGANVDVIVPHKTQSYADGGQADESGGIPMCTLRNFPHLIDHCIEWARAKFTDLFVAPAKEARAFLDDPFAFIAKQRSDVESKPQGGERASAVATALPQLRQLVASIRKAAHKPTMSDCVEMAFKVFHELFRDTIIDLVTRFPADHKTEAGTPFWSGHRKFPVAIKFDPSNELHVEFVISTANLFASMLKIHPPKHPSEQNKLFSERWMAKYRHHDWARAKVKRLAVPEYQKGIVADLDEETGEGQVDMAEEDAAETELKQLLSKLETIAEGTSIDLEPLDFEKDDDDNFHIDFITAAANLRAANYRIPAASRHKCKMIAGRIIPAVATSTAAVTGLVMMELYKVLQAKPFEELRNGNFDLGVNTYTFFEPNPPKKVVSKTFKEFDAASFERELSEFTDEVRGCDERAEKYANMARELEELPGASKETIQAAQKAADDARAYRDMLEEPNRDDFEKVHEIIAYPDGHSKWDKLLVPKTVTTIQGMVDFFKNNHNLVVSAWMMTDADGKGKQLYPPKAKLDPSLLPSAEMSKQQAWQALMKSVPRSEVQKYLSLWEKKRTGENIDSAEGDDPLKQPMRQVIEAVSGQPLEKRRKLALDDIALNNQDGKPVTCARVVLEL